MYSKTVNGLTHTLKVEGNKLVFERSGTVYNIYHVKNGVEQLICSHASLRRMRLHEAQAEICGQRIRIERVDL